MNKPITIDEPLIVANIETKVEDSLTVDQSKDQKDVKIKSASRDSSLNEDPRSIIDSVSGASGRAIWNPRDTTEDDRSISSIKGDSVSATIANYDKKHYHNATDSQSRASAKEQVGGASGIGESASGVALAGSCASGTGRESPRPDDLSSNINFFPTGESSNRICAYPGTSGSKGAISDFTSVSSNANIDAFEIIEEGHYSSSYEDLSQTNSTMNPQRIQHTCSKHTRRRHSVLDETFGGDDLPDDLIITQTEPIIIRGNGNLTLFGLSNSFSPEFPSALIGRVSREEFEKTMRRINLLLRDQQSLSAKLLLFGCLCCCCSLGLSIFWPSMALKKRSKLSLEKFLSSENNRLYSKLGLNWKLADYRYLSNHAFVEYVLMIEFSPKINLYLPD